MLKIYNKYLKYIAIGGIVFNLFVMTAFTVDLLSSSSSTSTSFAYIALGLVAISFFVASLLYNNTKGG